MIPDRLKCFLGDCHIYENQIAGVKTQLLRNPWLYDHPKLELNENVKDIYSYKKEDIKLKAYTINHYPSIKFPLSVGL